MGIKRRFLFPDVSLEVSVKWKNERFGVYMVFITIMALISLEFLGQFEGKCLTNEWDDEVIRTGKPLWSHEKEKQLYYVQIMCMYAEVSCSTTTTTPAPGNDFFHVMPKKDDKMSWSVSYTSE